MQIFRTSLTHIEIRITETFDGAASFIFKSRIAFAFEGSPFVRTLPISRTRNGILTFIHICFADCAVVTSSIAIAFIFSTFWGYQLWGKLSAYDWLSLSVVSSVGPYRFFWHLSYRIFLFASILHCWDINSTWEYTRD